ncbi:MAG TPA: M56 family metallopeptidase [Bryobacteraceae bacterium]
MSFLAECFLRVSAVLTVAFMAVFALRRRSSALRHLVWTAAFAVSALTPFLFPWGPALPRWPASASAQPPPTITTITMSAVTPQRANIGHPSHSSAAIPYGSIAIALWVAGVLAFGIRMGRAVRLARALRRGATRLDKTELASAAGLPSVALEQIDLNESDSAAAAMTMGVWKPVIILPAADRHVWEPSRLRAVMLHELAHVQRRDCLTQWLPQAICALHWFNPLVWLARSQMLCESERACDDAVLRGGVSGAGFARDLFEIAQSAGLKGADSMSLLNMSTTVVTKFERRIARLLDPSANRASMTRAGAIVSFAVAAALLLPLAGLRAQNAAPQAAGEAGTISGVVSDPTGAFVAGATIHITGHYGSWIVQGNQTGAWTGSFPPGTYQIDVSVPGFTARTTTVDLAAGASVHLQHALAIGQIGESITVTAPGTPKPAAAPAAGAPQRLRIGGMLQSAKLISKTPPVYPDSLRQQGVEGTVLIQAIIGKTGNVLNAAVVGGQAPAGGRGAAAGTPPLPEFADAALQAVRTWQYEPTLLNMEPVEVLTTIAVNFQLR